MYFAAIEYLTRLVPLSSGLNERKVVCDIQTVRKRLENFDSAVKTETAPETDQPKHPCLRRFILRRKKPHENDVSYGFS